MALVDNIAVHLFQHTFSLVLVWNIGRAMIEERERERERRRDGERECTAFEGRWWDERRWLIRL